MGKRKRGGKKGGKKGKKGAPPPLDDKKKVEQSFVMKRGKIPRSLRALLDDTRRVMLPHTAQHLKERRSNTIKDFLHVAGPLGVSHFLIYSATDLGSYLRVARVPNGPTLTFRIASYTLVRDIVVLQKNPHSPGTEFRHQPLVVLNNFKGPEEHVKLMSVIFQKMFSPLNIKKMKVEECKRVVLFEYDAETGTVQFRHYLVTSHPVGVSKSVKRMIVQKQVPDLSQLQDISQYVLRNARASESDLEDGDDTHVEVERQIKKKKRVAPRRFATDVRTKTQQSAVRLHELGPRLSLSLVKVQEGFCDGQVLYHQFVTKTPEEEAELEARKERERALKEERRQQQLLNLARKGKLPPGMLAPNLDTSSSTDAPVKDENDDEAEAEDEEHEADDDDEEAEQGGDEEGEDEEDEDEDDAQDYGSEGEEDAEIETLDKKKKSNKKNKKAPAKQLKKKRKVEVEVEEEVKEEAEEAMEEEEKKPAKKQTTTTTTTTKKTAKKEGEEGPKKARTPKFSLKVPVSSKPALSADLVAKINSRKRR